MNNAVHTELACLLLELEADLRNLQLWTDCPPAEEALASTEPFACDTLLFTEWLQYLFIPRLYELIRFEAMLPEKCEVAPMAEEYFSAKKLHGRGVVATLRQIDALITDSE